MSAFSETSVSLLVKRMVQAADEDEGNWMRFVTLYAALWCRQCIPAFPPPDALGRT